MLIFLYIISDKYNKKKDCKIKNNIVVEYLEHLEQLEQKKDPLIAVSRSERKSIV